MKRFLCGVLVGVLVSALAVMAEQGAGQQIVQPQVIVDTPRVKMVRWVLKPGEWTPIHTHDLDHISVVIHGSTVRDVDKSGTAKENSQKTGMAVYVPATGHTHSFGNIGEETFESISIELK
jgi:quercetin dioxygenase-like cupin family protein